MTEKLWKTINLHEMDLIRKMDFALKFQMQNAIDVMLRYGYKKGNIRRLFNEAIVKSPETFPTRKELEKEVNKE